MGEPSLRMQVARVALEAALSVDGVASTDAGPTGTRASVGGGRVVPGVVAVADRDRIALDLYLVARPVPLGPLAERVRERIVSRARTAGLDERLGRVDVRFEDLVPEEAR